MVPNYIETVCILRGTCPSQWDDAEGGNNDTLAQILGLSVKERIPYGRVGDIEQTTLRSFAKNVKDKLGIDSILLVGDKDKVIRKVAVIARSGNSLTEIMEFVKQQGVDVLVSGDITDGRARFAEEIGLNIIDAGDYFTENPGSKRLADILQNNIQEIKVLYLDPGKPWSIV